METRRSNVTYFRAVFVIEYGHMTMGGHLYYVDLLA
jgi:hypothetical protein